MKLATLAAAATLVASLATAPAAAQPRIATVTVVMAHHHFRPQVIRLKAGQRYRMLLVNRDAQGHNFDAKGFFSHARIAPEDGGDQAIHEGLVTVTSFTTRSFVVTPTDPGPFDLTSSVALDVAAGMQGQILVY